MEQRMRKGACIMTKTFIIESGQKPTEEQLSLKKIIYEKDFLKKLRCIAF